MPNQEQSDKERPIVPEPGSSVQDRRAHNDNINVGDVSALAYLVKPCAMLEVSVAMGDTFLILGQSGVGAPM